MTFLSVLSSWLSNSEDSCSHQDVDYVEGNCTYDDVSLQSGEIVLYTYRPYYRQCAGCGDTFYDTRYTADGTETPLGEPVGRTPIPHHVYSEYLREHEREIGRGR